MINEKLQTMQQKAEESVTGENDELAQLLSQGSKMFDKNAIRTTYASVINKAMSEMNTDFEKLADMKSPRSLATGSPLNKKLSIFKSSLNEIIGHIRDAIDENLPAWKKLKSGKKD